MEKRDPLRELGNTSDNNDTQETAKEPMLPEVLSSDKENVHMTGKTEPGKPGCGKLRVSFLKAFDPLFSESPESLEVQSEPVRTRQQLVIEDSDTDRSLSPLPIDVSDDDACFVDATYIAPSEHDTTDESEPPNKHHKLEESLLKFYTPEKQLDSTLLKSITESTSETAKTESVLSENKEPVATSDDQSEEDKSSYSTEEKNYSINGDITDISDGKFVSSEEENNEYDSSEDSGVRRVVPTRQIAEAINARNTSDLNSEIGGIKDNFPTISKELKTQQPKSSEDQLKHTDKSDKKPSDDSTDKSVVATTSGSAEKASVKDNNTKENQAEDFVESDGTDNNSDPESVEEVSKDTKDSETDEGFRSSEEKVSEDLNKTIGIEKAETELSEKFQEHVKSVTDKEEKATCSKETALGASEQESVICIQAGTSEVKAQPEEKEDHLKPNKEAEEEANKTFETVPSVGESKLVSEEKIIAEAATSPESDEPKLESAEKEEGFETFDTCTSAKSVEKPKLESAEKEATEGENLKTSDTCTDTKSVEEPKLESAEKETTEGENLKTSDTFTSAESVEEPKLETGEATKESVKEEEEAIKTVDTTESTTEGDTTISINQDEDHHLDSGVESAEHSYTSPKTFVDKLDGDKVSDSKEDTDLLNNEIVEEGRVDSDGQLTSDDDSKTLSEGSIQSDQVLSESKEESDAVESSESQEAGGKTEEKAVIDPVKSSEIQASGKTEEKAVTSQPTFDIDFYRAKMADLSEKLSQQQQENSDLKLQLNASQQAKATLELEIRQKEEVIIKTQAEALKNEQVYKQEIKQLREKLKENSKLIEKDGSKELEEQLKEAKAREAKAIAELNQRTKDDLNYQKIMEEYENTIATRFADYQKLKEEHETATRHLANIELAFSDVHQKYERTKALLEGFKSNEETLTLSLQASERMCKQHEDRYESLKAHAKAQIEKSNKEIIMLRDKYEMDINKFRAIIKRLEIKCSSLEVSLQQKTEECSALSALCDEVTGKRV